MAAVQLFDEVFRLGDLISGERRKAGYKTLSAFSKAIERKTGYQISKDQLQRIESGKQEPKIIQYMSIAATLGLLRDPLLIESMPGRMSASVISFTIDEFLEANPDVHIESREYESKDSIKLYLSNGHIAQIDPFRSFTSRISGVSSYNPSESDF